MHLIGTGGALSALNNGNAVSSGFDEVSMDISPDGNWLFGLNADNPLPGRVRDRIQREHAGAYPECAVVLRLIPVS